MNLAIHYPILQVAVPLLAAPLCIILKRSSVCWALAGLVTIVTLFLAGSLLSQTLAQGVISYAIGGWAPPWGIEYRVDTLDAFVLVIIAAMGTIVMLYARRSVDQEIDTEKHYLFYTAYLLCLTGLLGIAITGDAFNLFVFLEISSLSTYALVSMGKDRRALTASYQYLIMGTLGATFYLIGVGLLYMVTGTLNMADLAKHLPALFDSRTVRTALAFLTVGISLKLALFPLHLWLPNVYTYAPSVVTAFLSGTATKVAVYILIRVLFTLFGVDFSLGAMPLDIVLLILSLIAIVSASTVAIFQDDVKRMLAYSSVAQIGYIVLGLSLVSETGLVAALVHLFNHALMKGALFLALGCVFYRIGSVEIKQLAGLGKRMPWTMAAVVGGGLSLIGVPLTAGFVSKWYLVVGALERELWLVAATVLVGSLLAVIYIWRLVEVAYFKPRTENGPVTEAPASLLIPTWILIVANFYFGVCTDLTAGVARRAAMQLMGVAQ
ncbi:MAG: monovalent cation/H+ antiporter subunit D family protein [Gammaproteobacteria bacterium]